MLHSVCAFSEAPVTSHWQRQEPGTALPVLCASLAACVRLYNGNKAGLQGPEATPAWTQDQLDLQFSLVLKTFRNRSTRATPRQPAAVLGKTSLQVVPHVWPDSSSLAGRPPPSAVHHGCQEWVVPSFYTTYFYVLNDCCDAASLIISSPGSLTAGFPLKSRFLDIQSALVLVSVLSPVESHTGWNTVPKPGCNPTWSLLSAECYGKGCFRCLAFSVFICATEAIPSLVPAGRFWVLLCVPSITTSDLFP